MKGQISPLEQVLREKILQSARTPPPAGLTRRDARLPGVKGKAFAVIGMRRAGKTSFLHQCRAGLLAAGRTAERLLYFNFEDERLGDLDAGRLGLIPDTLFRLFPEPAEEKLTLFLDEVQRVPGWEVFARRLLDTAGYELFLSGSSARLLSREIATAMRGRAWEIVIQPFSFREYLRHRGLPEPDGAERLDARQRARFDHHFAAWLGAGGFPEAQDIAPDERRQLLQNYVDVVLLRDVIERHGAGNVTALRWLVRRLLGNPAGLFSVTRVAADLQSQGVSASRDTLREYLAHLEDAFLLQTVPVATDSEKRRQVNPCKVYPADTGLIPVFDRSGKPNTGHALETAVFNHLRLRGAELGYIKTPEGFEVDFLATFPDGARELIQVCADTDAPETLERETRALAAAGKQWPKARRLILTLESRLPFPALPRGMEIMPAWEYFG
jgi:predicted AAA+ superfamily ATPase